MTDRLVRLIRGLAVGGVLFVALVFTLPAYADDTEPPKPASISFMDEGKLTVDRKWLEGKGGELLISIRNNTTEAQTVGLSLEGFVPPLSKTDEALERLLPDREEDDLAPGATGVFTLSFTIDVLDVFTATASYPGVLVATSFPGGDVIRREFELQVKAEEPAPVKPEGEKTALSKLWDVLWKSPKTEVSEQLTSLTLAGVNFLPSLLSPLPLALFWIGVALLLLRWGAQMLKLKVSWGNLKLKMTEPRVQKTLFLWGVVLVGLGAVMSVISWAGWGGPWEPALVYVKPVSMPSGARLGPVAAGDGSLGVLERGTGERVELRRIPHAGAYEGSIDLLPDDKEKGAMTIKVNVADWWPFAFLTIALGVLVGYRLTQYYGRERSAMEQRVRAAQLWQEIVEEESGFQEKHAGRPYAAYSIVGLARDWINRVEEKLSKGDIDGAKTLLDKLDTYAKLFVVFQQRGTKRLDNLHDQLRQQFKKRNFGLKSVSDVEALQRTKALAIGTPFDFSIEDEDGNYLKAKKKDVEQAVAWVEELVDTLDDIDRWIDYAEGLKIPPGRSWSQEVVDELGKLLTSTRTNAIKALQNELDTGALNQQIDGLKSAGGKALLAKKKEDVQAQREEATKAYYKIVELARKAATEASARATAPTGVTLFMWEETKRALGVVVEESTGERKIVVPEPPKVSCTVWALDGQMGTDCHADSDDLFAFTASIKFSTPLLTDYDVQWDFGDGATSRIITIPKNTTGSKRVETSHRFRVGGARKVQLMALKDGVSTPLGEGCDVLVKPRPGRLEQRQATFRLSDLHMTVVSGLLAVGTGLSALYTSTWGTPSDYLKAFLWGSVVSEATKAGAKVVRDLAKGKWPMGA